VQKKEGRASAGGLRALKKEKRRGGKTKKEQEKAG
jgi:hypothetical protein